jgi:Ser/Thr protein kinase RdoA (MazF antagonist)
MRCVPTRVFATHDIAVEAHQVVKRFRSWDRGEHYREWQALVMLANYAPGLAPAPLGCDLDSVPPSVRMSRVPGHPLAGQAITPTHLEAVTVAVNRLHAAVPAEVLAAVPPQPWLAAGALNQMKSSLAAGERPAGTDPVVLAAFDAATRWRDHAAEPHPEAFCPVFGQGDGNLANYLWDGQQVRLVDFEDSGRSDRAFELAAFTEHLSVWHDANVETGTLLGRFELTPAEAARVLFFRRAFGFFWLLKLLSAREERLNALRTQAHRLLVLLDACGGS